MRAQRGWIAPAATGLAAFLLSLFFVQTGTWSVFDEYTHFDYVVKVGEDLSFPPVNDVLGEQALRTAICESAPGFESLSELCEAGNLTPEVAPYAGASTATGYLPIYYAVTGLGAKVLVAAPGDLGWLQAARVIGAVFLGITAMLLVGIARRLGATSGIASAGALLVASMPMVLLQFSTVNNDSLATLLSTASIYSFLALRSSRWATRWGVAYGLSLLAVATKEIAVFSTIAITVLALRDAVRARDGRRMVIALLAAVATVAIPILVRSAAWPAIVGELQDNGLQNAAIVAAQGTPPINLVFANALNQIPTVFQVPTSLLAGAWFGVAAMVVTLVGFGLCLGLVLHARRRQWQSPRTLLAAVVIAYPPPLLAASLPAPRCTGMPLFFQPRYLLPVAVIAVAVGVTWIRPAWTRVLLPVSVLYVVAVMGSLLVAAN